jgi:Ni,Fe-hydrogenase I cytochrome b subunit
VKRQHHPRSDDALRAKKAERESLLLRLLFVASLFAFLLQLLFIVTGILLLNHLLHSWLIALCFELFKALIRQLPIHSIKT